MPKRRYRTHFDIISDILKVTLTPKMRTDIYYEAKLGGTQYTAYVNQALKNHLMKKLPNDLLVTTEKGKQYLEVFKQIKSLLGLEEG